jgi:bifunctional non-homologous end joining protein LigD
MCVLDDIGRSDFNRLHARARKRRADPDEPVVYCVFDVLASQGRSVMDQPLTARKKLLEPLRGLPGVLVVDQIPAEGEALYGYVLSLKLEGLVAKRMDSKYRPGVRSLDWLKIKRPGAVPAERFKRS